jgi:hypothetical protein
MIKRPARHTPNRTRLPVAQQPPLAFIGTTFSIDAGNARLVFDQPVVVRALPLGITRQAAGAGPQLVPTAFNQVDANTLDLTYAAAVVATDVVTIPNNVQEVRGSAGGFLAAAVWTF